MTFPTRRIGTTRVEASVLGFGGVAVGNLFEHMPEDRALATIEQAWTSGVRFFDTSPYYGHGLSEHRFGHVLRSRIDDGLVISTKVGRVLRPEKPEHINRGVFAGGLNFAAEFDYSYDGAMRSLEHSYHRLGMNRIDVVFIHDVDVGTYGSVDEYHRRRDEAMAGSYRALDELRGAGVIGAIGVGVNEVEPCVWFAQQGRFDCFLLAGRYTLLEQNGLDDLFPLANAQQFSIILGGPFNSGILATGAKQGAMYNYKPAPPDILARVDRIEAVCARHDVPLAAAALQFPLGHPRVASIIPGAARPEEAAANAALMARKIPDALWADLKAEGLMIESAPV
jgi:D-threo-aldose 1-dehydrogenase